MNLYIGNSKSTGKSTSVGRLCELLLFPKASNLWRCSSIGESSLDRIFRLLSLLYLSVGLYGTSIFKRVFKLCFTLKKSLRLDPTMLSLREFIVFHRSKWRIFNGFMLSSGESMSFSSEPKLIKSQPAALVLIKIQCILYVLHV